jgi:hypothetical protein
MDFFGFCGEGEKAEKRSLKKQKANPKIGLNA